jgi:hypothetical protein
MRARDAEYAVARFPSGEILSAGGQATVTATGNTIHGNGAGANGQPGTTVEAQSNWWGCTQGPNMGHCDTAVGTVSFTPWLTAKP